MRPYIKRKCREMIRLLEDAHAQIERFIQKGSTDEAMGLLEEAQASAISIGGYIDDSQGDGTDEVHALEDYCELVYLIYQDLASGNTADAKRQLKTLRKPLLKVKNGLLAFPDTREAVFLPYKASMWDSLESVWKKADQDPDCSAIVVPIPYYEKKPDGSMKSIKYEIDQYPDYVPVVRYTEYDLEENHPEEIYIHNPYDDMNLVTSVLPQFYSSKLKECTDMLVYIPYYVLGEPDPDNEQGLEGMAHFVTVPAVANADRVIVQSENMKKAYVNILSKYSGEKTRPMWEKKIEGTGSPKLERVENLTDKDFDMPGEWKTVAEKPDGTRKKIIFYNTGIAAMLEANEKMIDKIRRNLEFFKDNLEDVALLWRPHPLIEATLTSMRPELWEEYKDIVDKYRSEGWGIYDDSAELDRAIAISDAYYGDPSSVVELYKKTKKPIMIQNADV